MKASARVILNKLKLVDPATTPTFSAYQQSAEIRQLWISIESSITTILNIVSNKFAENSMDASSQIISVLSASTLLSSIIHAIISTQRRLQKSDENIENVIKKEMQVILYHIQILRQDLNQSNAKTESAQEAIIHHADVLIDSLVAYSLSPSNVQFPAIHPYKVSPSASFTRRHSQPAAIFRTQSANENMISQNLAHNQYGSSSSLFSNNSSASSSTKKKTDTVGKKFMRSINSLKSRPAFQMTLLPSRHPSEPTSTEKQPQQRQPPKKKRLFYDHRNTDITSESQEDPDYSDNSMTWDDDSSSSTSFPKSNDGTPTKPHLTLRFMFNGRRHSQTTAFKSENSTSIKTAANTGGIREIFQSTAIIASKEDGPITSSQRRKRESLSSLFGGNKNKQSITKENQSRMPEFIYSSSSSITTPSTSTDIMKNQSTETSTKLVPSRSFLISPFAKKTDIEWSMGEEQEISSAEEDYNIDSMTDSAEDDTCDPEPVIIKRENSRKRRSNGSLVAPSLPPKILCSIPMTRNNSPLPPLPTVENFLTIMNAPTSPDSSYFSARSTSSSSSSTISSIILDDVTDSLAKAHIDISHDKYVADDACTPPIPPPKDHINNVKNTDKRQHMDPQDHSLTNMNNKQEKRRSSTCSGSLKRNSSTEMRISTSDISNHHHPSSPPRSADVFLPKKRPPIPPRTSSMPLQTPKLNIATEVPPLPASFKKRTSEYNRRASTKTLVDENLNILLDNNTVSKKNDLSRRTKLGRSLGAPSPSLKKIKKSDSGKLLKVTENGKAVLLFEMMDGKLQAIAGTTEKLFEKLADETAQEEEYLDIYLMNHAHFISSIDLLNSLINRFHLEPSPGEYEYFIKWQYSIQSKVLNVVSRWITLYYYQDFKDDKEVLKRLNLFLYNDSLLLAPQFKEQLDKIRSCLKSQTIQYSDDLSLLLTSKSPVNQNNTTTNFNFHLPFVNNNYAPPFPPVHFSNSPRRPSNGLFSLTSPPASPVYNPTSIYTSLSSLDSKDIAKYLTLADYYLFKLIQVHGSLFNCKSNNSSEVDYVELMTKRANMLSHWVVHEICSITYLKPKRTLLKKFIEIAKLCLEQNNYHTCMVITMGLSSAPKLKEVRESLSNRDTNTFSSLQKLLNVSLNMRYYRQKIQLAKSPAIPFLPVLLKDQTFFNENSTYSVLHPNLINFSKFRSIYQFNEKNKLLTSESFSFSQDLTHFPFLSFIRDNKKVYNGQLDSIGDWIENRLSKVQHCYLDCNLLCNL